MKIYENLGSELKTCERPAVIYVLGVSGVFLTASSSQIVASSLYSLVQATCRNSADESFCYRRYRGV